MSQLYKTVSMFLLQRYFFSPIPWPPKLQPQKAQRYRIADQSPLAKHPKFAPFPLS